MEGERDVISLSPFLFLNSMEIEKAFKRGELVFFEMIALTLEEIFISETEVVGYDIRKFIMG